MHFRTQYHCHLEARLRSVELHSRRRPLHMLASVAWSHSSVFCSRKCHREARPQSLELHSRHRQLHMGANGFESRTHPHTQSHCHLEARPQSVELHSRRRQLHMSASEPDSHTHPHTQHARRVLNSTRVADNCIWAQLDLFAWETINLTLVFDIFAVCDVVVSIVYGVPYFNALDKFTRIGWLAISIIVLTAKTCVSGRVIIDYFVSLDPFLLLELGLKIKTPPRGLAEEPALAPIRSNALTR
jgi:hypothetical protein